MVICSKNANKLIDKTALGTMMGDNEKKPHLRLPDCPGAWVLSSLVARLPHTCALARDCIAAFCALFPTAYRYNGRDHSTIVHRPRKEVCKKSPKDICSFLPLKAPKPMNRRQIWIAALGLLLILLVSTGVWAADRCSPSAIEEGAFSHFSLLSPRGPPNQTFCFWRA